MRHPTVSTARLSVLCTPLNLCAAPLAASSKEEGVGRGDGKGFTRPNAETTASRPICSKKMFTEHRSSINRVITKQPQKQQPPSPPTLATESYTCPTSIRGPRVFPARPHPAFRGSSSTESSHSSAMTRTQLSTMRGGALLLAAMSGETLVELLARLPPPPAPPLPAAPPPAAPRLVICFDMGMTQFAASACAGPRAALASAAGWELSFLRALGLSAARRAHAAATATAAEAGATLHAVYAFSEGRSGVEKRAPAATVARARAVAESTPIPPLPVLAAPEGHAACVQSFQAALHAVAVAEARVSSQAATVMHPLLGGGGPSVDLPALPGAPEARLALAAARGGLARATSALSSAAQCAARDAPQPATAPGAAPCTLIASTGEGELEAVCAAARAAEMQAAAAAAAAGLGAAPPPVGLHLAASLEFDALLLAKDRGVKYLLMAQGVCAALGAAPCGWRRCRTSAGAS